MKYYCNICQKELNTNVYENNEIENWLCSQCSSDNINSPFDKMSKDQLLDIGKKLVARNNQIIKLLKERLL